MIFIRRSHEIFNSSSSKLSDFGFGFGFGFGSDVSNPSDETKVGIRKKENTFHGQNPHRRKIKENKHRKNKRRRKDGKSKKNRLSSHFHSEDSIGNKTTHKTAHKTTHKRDDNLKNRSRRKFIRRKLRKGSNSTKRGNENPFLTTTLLRGKRLSHTPRRFRLNGGRGQGHSITRSLLGTSPDWVRNLHYHHEQLASSMRKRIQNQLDRTRQHWLTSINPHSVLYNSIPTFPDITDNLIPSLPSFYSSFIPSSRRKKNNYPTKIPKDGKEIHFVESKPNNYVPRMWTNEITTSPSVFNDSYTAKRDQKQFKVTRTLFSPTSTTTEKSVFQKFNPEEDNSVWHNPKKGFSTPKPTNYDPKNVNDNKIPPLTERPFKPSNEIPEEKINKNWGTKFIPYGNDVTKGKNNGLSGKGKGKEQDWEWVPLHKEDNDVNYDPTVIEEEEEEEEGKDEEEEKEEEEKEEEEKEEEEKEKEEEEEETQIETTDNEDEVYKCPPLPSVQGGSVECTAGEAWGSKCFWKCDKDRRLIGTHTTSCGGDNNSPSWQNKPPICEEYGCLIPKGLEGMSISCSIPVPHEILGQKLEKMKFYPKGTRCQVKCKPGFALKGDEYSGKNVQMSKCLPNGKWFPELMNCCTRERIPPQPFIGDCDDVNVQLTGQGSIHLIAPRFFTSTGKPAHVWCDLDTVQQEGRHCRTCKAHDKSLGLLSSCRQCINVSSRLVS
ncbi:hypothetical protein Anas_04344 [Armadillidium nasatum]|uniref:Sushi domain-containing protein n=1 Tax=Armadillidium nasatum TaxID=96803 RepID=A0A5N5SZE1_9CRUS|nr:hypothetical protein Anas_04344 [Armadillidium nasatum]